MRMKKIERRLHNLRMEKLRVDPNDLPCAERITERMFAHALVELLDSCVSCDDWLRFPAVAVVPADTIHVSERQLDKV